MGSGYDQEWWSQLERNLGSGFRRLKGPVIAAVVLVIIAAWAASGIYSVGPGEQAVIRQFGRQIGLTGPGLRYRLPWPIQRHDIVDVATVRRIEVGFRTTGTPARAVTVDQEALMLTGDENIVEVHFFVQYVANDPAAFIFNLRDPEEVLHSTAEAALRSVVGMNTIDHTMTEGRVEIQGQVHQNLQALMDLYGSGLLITDARLLVVDPPTQVREAFHDVVRAWEDRERLVQEAEGYREDILPRARGEAFEVIQQAQGYREAKILRAEGDASRFTAILEEYSEAQEVTRERLFLEMVEGSFAGVKMYVIDSSAGGNLMQLLPLEGLDLGGGSSR